MSNLTNSQISQNLINEWMEQFGDKSAKQNGTNIFLYWYNEQNNKNHVHFFINDDVEVWKYNIKCNNNKGDDRETFDVNQSTIEELMDTVQNNWVIECPEHTSPGGGKILYKRTKTKRRKKKGEEKQQKKGKKQKKGKLNVNTALKDGVRTRRR
jgi:hypothetical protein